MTVNHRIYQHTCLSTKTKFILVDHSYSKLSLCYQKIIIYQILLYLKKDSMIFENKKQCIINEL